MKKITFSISIFIFAFYWTTTVFFNMPDNFIKLQLNDQERYFQNIFSQRWEFFAPPPDYNERLYFTFIQKDNKLEKTLEVLKPILDEKRANVPFNKNADILDYLLSNSINAIIDLMVEQNKIFTYEKRKTINKNEMTDDDFTNLTTKMLQQTNNFKLIKNYAKIVANRNGLEKYNHIIISIAKRDITKFHQRFDNITPSEDFLFISDTLKLN